MKKRIKGKSAFAPRRAKPDLTGLIISIQQQLTSIEGKIDALTGQPSAKPFERKNQPEPFQRFDHSRRPVDTRQGNDYRARILHKAICADCRKECEVPFRPSPDRPVYCKDCFAKRKGAGSFKGSTDNRPREAERVHVSHAGHPQGPEKKKFYEKKVRPSKRRKDRG